MNVDFPTFLVPHTRTTTQPSPSPGKDNKTTTYCHHVFQGESFELTDRRAAGSQPLTLVVPLNCHQDLFAEPPRMLKCQEIDKYTCSG